MTYRELYQNLFDVHVVSLFYLKPVQPSFPKWYDANAQCEYHTGIIGHSIDNCTAFKKLTERFIKIRIVRFDDPSGPNVVRNLLPKHSDQGVNVIIESGGKRTKTNVAEVITPLKWVWQQMIDVRLIIQDSKGMPKRMRSYCEFQVEEGYEIQECAEFKALMQSLMDKKELKFFEDVKGLEGGDVCASEEGSINKVYKVNQPVVIISRPRSNEVGSQAVPRVIIQKLVHFPYKDSKRVPWNYDCNVMIPREENSIDTLEEGQNISFYMRSGRCYDPTSARTEPIKGKTLKVEHKKKIARLESLVNEPVTENEAKEFLKLLKHSEYSVVEQLHKQPARISVLPLLFSLETHRSALMKVLNETYVADDISVNKLDRLVSNLSANNFIFFNDYEIPLRGMGSTKALHITTHYKDIHC
ncbi:uncharacterized protein LOC128032582 [Gossypium raimondii]|uniref:uncharacterized protein LOC128032582 n=1 Tax=Gossypium raimondii TaxID=29730 RepID=UPI00227BD80B|nr:uncharacterized protein LOC128032582 [Gossypium raimondii]